LAVVIPSVLVLAAVVLVMVVLVVPVVLVLVLPHLFSRPTIVVGVVDQV
jgi:hypothetical protein